FVEWESAEPDAMPLWGLLYFPRPYALSGARAAGERSRRAGFAAHGIDYATWSHTLPDPVRRSREQVGLSSVMIEALFYTCWLHRALKQATLLPPEQVDRDGHYANLLRLCLGRREGPTFRRILGA